MRRTLFVIALLTALVPPVGSRASVPFALLGEVSGYSTGTAIHSGVLETGSSRLTDVEVAFSGANVNSTGLGAALTNEMKQAFQPATQGADKSGGRGSGLEIGLATTVPNVTNANQINPGSLAQAFAPPSSGLITKEFTPVNLDPIVNATLLRGQAQPTYSNDLCVLGQPISFGLGYAANANLVNSGTDSLLSSHTVDNAVHQSKSFTYLIPNGDGTYGLVTETHQILAPVTLFGGTSPVVIELAGEWLLRTTATGKPGGAKVEYAPVGSPTSTTKVITIRTGASPGTEIASLTTQQLLSQEGLVVPIPGVGEIAIGEDPRAIGGNAASKPELAADGTVAAAAVDIVRATTSELATAIDIDIKDLRVGHMESRAQVPAGGIQCGIPVRKTGTPAWVEAGNDELVTYTITLPADVEAFKAVACDLVNIKVVDVTTADPDVKFNIVSASKNGSISGNTVTWGDLGKYTPGDPPIVLTVGLKVPSDSAAGTIIDTATATGVLGNCKGNASANAASLTGLAALDTAALTGSDASSTTTLWETRIGTGVMITADPTPVGGVQTGAGGTNHRGSHLLPLGAGLGSIALAGFMTSRRRRRIG
jgi:hypothetical protein